MTIFSCSKIPGLALLIFCAFHLEAAEPYLPDSEIDRFFLAEGRMSYDDARLQDFLSQITRSHPLTPVAESAPEIHGNAVEIVDTAERASELWVSLIREAQHHIHIQTYFIVDDVEYHDEDPVPCEQGPEVLERNYIACMLWQAAERGVHIRFMADSLGNTDVIVGGATILQQLARHPKIDIMNYNPVMAYNLARDSLWEPYGVWLWPQNRLHSKVLIVDGRSALTGGRNIGRNYMKPAPDHPPPDWGPRVYGLSSDYKYRDTDILVTGPAVGTMQRSFMKNWLEFGDWEQTITDSAGVWPSLNPGTWVNKGDCLQQVYYGVRYYCKKNDQRLRDIHTPDEIAADAELFPALPTTGGSLVRYLDSDAVRAGHIPDRPYLRKLQENALHRPRVSDAELDPYRGLTNGERVYLTLIHNAQKSIRLTNSYFALSQPMRKALREAVERGVKLEIFTNSYQSNDEAILWDCSVPDFKNFLDLGAEIYEWMSQAGMLHAKSALFDDTIAIVSSFNFDNASFKSNMESLAVIRGATAMDSMKRVWDLDMENPMTRKMTPDTLQKDANSRGIKGYLARPICSKLGGDN